MLTHEELDAICTEFENQWAGTNSASVEEFLDGRPDVTDELVEELILVEVDLAFAARLSPRQDHYEERFPAHLTAVGKAFERIRKLGREATQVLTSGGSDSLAGFRPREDSEVPEQLGDYRILERLGAGQFGVVFRAIHIETDEIFALKFPLKKSVNSPRELEQLQNGANIAAELNHRGIVKSFGLRQESDFWFHIQQFIGGVTLASKRKELKDPESVATIVAQIAEALGYAHREGIFHRDIKPDNVMLNQDGQPLITDFGLSIHESVQHRLRGQKCGTPPYMSPEQVEGLTHLMDGRSDIWSLGVTLYELLTGVRPFQGATQGDLFEQIRLRHEKPLRFHRPDLDREIQRICSKCLAKQSRDRYDSAEQLASDLRNWIEFRDQWQAATTAPLIPRGLAPFRPEDAEAFVELLPGPRNQQGVPDSIDFWLSRLQSPDQPMSVPVGVIFGPTGSGKSSFIRAGVLPALDSRIISAEYIEATPADTEVRIAKALRGRYPNIPGNVSLPEMFDGLRNCCWHNEQRLVIVLDQFEQWLQETRQLEESQLVQALRQCDGHHLTCILLIRDEYWLRTSRLFEVLGYDLRERENAQRLDRFDLKHARIVLRRLGTAYGKLPANDCELTKQHNQFLDQVIADLSDDERIVGIHLVLFAEVLKDQTWDTRGLERVGGARAAGARLISLRFSEVMRGRVPENVARGVLGELLPDSGSSLKGHMRRATDLVATLGQTYPHKVVKEVLTILARDLKLIEETTPQGAGSRTTENLEPMCYQLTHDYLVPSIRRWIHSCELGSWQGRAARRLAELSAEWKFSRDRRYFPTLFDCITMKVATRHTIKTSHQRAFLQAATRYQCGRCTAILCTIAILCWGVLTLTNQTEDAETRAFVQSVRQSSIHNLATKLREAEQLSRSRRNRSITYIDTIQDPDWKCHLLALSLGDESENRLSSVIQSLDTVSPLECRLVFSELSHRPASATLLRNQFDVATSPLAQARLASGLMYQNRVDAAKRLCADSADPTAATTLAHELVELYATADDLWLLLNHHNASTDLRFFLILAAAHTRLEPDGKTREEWASYIRNCFIHDPDSGIHSACLYLANRWHIKLPALTATHQPVPDQDWWVVDVGGHETLTFVRVPEGDINDKPYLRNLSPHTLVYKKGQGRITELAWACTVETPGATVHRWLDEQLKTGKTTVAASASSRFEISKSDLPAYGLSFDETQIFLAWCNGVHQPAGYQFSLLNMDEFQKAASGHARTFYPFGSAALERYLQHYAVIDGQSNVYVENVRQCSLKAPNRIGTFGMLGNLMEFVSRVPRNLKAELRAERCFMAGGNLLKREQCFPGFLTTTDRRSTYFPLVGHRLALRHQNADSGRTTTARPE